MNYFDFRVKIWEQNLDILESKFQSNNKKFSATICGWRVFRKKTENFSISAPQGFLQKQRFTPWKLDISDFYAIVRRVFFFRNRKFWTPRAV